MNVEIASSQLHREGSGAVRDVVEACEDACMHVRENFEKAAILLKCSPMMVRTRLYRMSLKYEAAKRFCKEYRSWQQRLYQKSGGGFHNL